MAIDPATAGLLVGGSLLSNVFGAQAANDQRDYYNRILKRRRRDPATSYMREALGEISRAADIIPGMQRDLLQGRLASQAQLESQRLDESLARAGVTGVSELALRGRRRIGSGIEQSRQQGMLGIENLSNRLRQSQIGASQSVLNALYPSAGQAYAQAAPQNYFDPSDIMSNIAAPASCQEQLAARIRIRFQDDCPCSIGSGKNRRDKPCRPCPDYTDLLFHKKINLKLKK